jgi:class 3 adenylate cyclase/tetratricopeptide (TPR) repeat protein
MDEVERLEQAIRALEAQRGSLGDAIVDVALAPMREKLASLRQAPGIEARRVVTALFSDLAGFTAMSERMDPEDVREIMNHYLSAWQASVEAHGGVVEKFIGDAVMAVFGLTTVREDDPQQAVACGLDMLGKLESLNQDYAAHYGLHLNVRIGIHTGPVVVSTLGERKGHDFVAVGDTINLASRLQSAAPVNGILISHDTQRHIHGVFDCQALEPILVKGKTQPIRVYAVKGWRASTQRTTGRGIAGLSTPLVGRQAELVQLQHLYEQVVHTQAACMVMITGDPGVGKSRLLAEFSAWVDMQPSPEPSILSATAHAHTADIPYSLLHSAFSKRCDILESDAQAEMQSKLVNCLEAGFEQDGLMKTHFIGALLGFDFFNSPFLQGVRDDPRQLRERALFYLGQWLSAQAQAQPVFLALDDIQWADQASLETVHWLIEHCAAEPVLVVCLARQKLGKMQPQWETRLAQARYLSHWLKLKPLSAQDSARLLQEILAGGSQSTAPAIQRLQELVIDTAGGNPYYLEELLKMLFEQEIIQREDGSWRVDAERLGAMETPPTLNALLQARLDSLPASEREVLQKAAVIGRVFWDQLLQVLQGDRLALGQHLDGLLQREMIYQHETSTFEDSQEFGFEHVLLRDVAYDTLLRKHRQGIHARIAQWLGQHAGQQNRRVEFAPVVAHHYDQAGVAREAAEWWLLAAQNARRRGGLAEGRHNLDRALALIPTQESDLRWATLYEYCGLLAEIGDLPARQANEAELLHLAKASGDPRKLALAYQKIATTHGYQGDNSQALEALQIAHQYAQQCQDLTILVGVSSFMIATLTRMGRLQQAGVEAQHCLALARKLTDERELVIALVNASLYYAAIGDHSQSAGLVQEAVELSRKLGDLVGQARGLNNLGYSYVIMGLYEQGAQALRQSAQISESIGAWRDVAYARLNLGLAHIGSGKTDSAIQELENGTHSLSEQGDAFGQAAGALYHGFVLEAAHQARQAAAKHSQAVERFAYLHMTGSELDGRAGLARCFLALGDLPGARAQADLVWQHLKEPGEQALEFPIAAFLACAEVFAACHDQTAARQAFARGNAELQRLAGQISDPEWRVSFLANVPSHRLLAQKFQEFGDDQVQ